MAERRLAVITGASSGIGTSFARKLAGRGYDLLLTARREDRLHSLASELSAAYKVTAEVLPADLAQESDLERVASRLASDPKLELLINNAGFGSNGYFYETDVRGQEAMHKVHVLATMRLTHAAIGNLTARARTSQAPQGNEAIGGVINVSSVAAFGRAPQNISYCATKAWMNAFTEGLSIELAALHLPIRVQALCPGYTLTEFHDVLGMDRGPIPQSMWMTPDFVADASLTGFERNELFVVPGWRYKWMVAALRILPSGLIRKGAIAGVRRFRKRRGRV